jgi:hypothetical protein
LHACRSTLEDPLKGKGELNIVDDNKKIKFDFILSPNEKKE